MSKAIPVEHKTRCIEYAIRFCNDNPIWREAPMRFSDLDACMEYAEGRYETFDILKITSVLVCTSLPA